MPLPEPIRIPTGFTLIVDGLDHTTNRQIDFPRTWTGLGAADAYLLQRWLGDLGAVVRSLHTDVPVGVVPTVNPPEFNDFVKAQAAILHPLRIDACILLEDGWRVCEIKPDAGYLSLGQALTYHYFACRTNNELASCVPMVLTDHVQEAIRPVFDHYGVEIVEVGGPLN